MKNSILIAALAASCFALTATAGPGDAQRAKVDANGDGAISLEEVTAMQSKRFAALDLNGDGKVSADEISTATLERQKERIQRMAEMQVKSMDSNGDGVVSEEEFSARTEEGFARRDANDDGRLTRDEMRQQRGSRRGPQDDG